MGIHVRQAGRPRQQAFTVLELLVTLVIATIMLLLGVPSFQQFTERQHMRAAVGNLHNDLLAARSEAVYRNQRVVACPGEPSLGCSDSADWSDGWFVFADTNDDRLHQADEAVIRHGQVFEAVQIVGTRGRTSIRFLPDGSAPGSNATIGFCGRAGPAQARKLVISNIGRIRRDAYEDVDPALCESGG